MKVLLAIAFFISVSTTASAQKAEDTSRLHFTTFFGLGLVNQPLQKNIANGFQAATGLEYKLSAHSTLAGDLSFDSYGYKQAGASYALDGTLNTASLSLFYKYNFGSGRWQPYLRAGGGLARLSVPSVSVKSGFTGIKNETQFVGQAQVEGGLQYHLNARYTFLAGVGQQWFGKSNLLDNGSFRVTGLKLGFITPL